MAVTRRQESDMGVITIRRSQNQDSDAIGRLAGLDSRHEPRGDALLAFDNEALVAALPLDGGEAIADPFHYTAEIVDLLRLRAAQGEAPATVRRERHLRRLGLVEGRAA
jgi:hypothetical protein